MVFERLGSEWVVLHTVGLLQMSLTVFARKHALGSISGVQSSRSATGLGHGTMGNKGGLLVALKYGNSSLGFISCHMAAHIEARDNRNHDFWEVLRETSRRAGSTTPLFSFDHLFMIGDLNYRIELPRDPLSAATVSDSQEKLRDTPEAYRAATALVRQKNFAQLLAYDQLRKSQQEGTAFVGFVEAASFAFAPTFKVERRAGTTYKKARVPSYCDRVLWKSMPTAVGNITQTYFNSVPAVSTSDHKPVVAHFSIQPTPVLHPALNSPLLPVVRLSDVRVFLRGGGIDFLSETCDPYATFSTHPPGMLGEDTPLSATLRSKRRVPWRRLLEDVTDECAREYLSAELTTARLPHGYQWAWSARELPVLRPRVQSAADLRHVNLIVNLFDHDRFGKDDSLGTIAIPLGQPAAHGGTDDAYQFDVRMPVAWEGGMAFITCVVSVAAGDAVPGALLQAQREGAGRAASTMLARQQRASCTGAPACSVQ
mmetsp:Transcript_16021/g.38085  ORF Transcript_16021/g.38085 Transcript_16021/m.38085 type:complete len:484 (-) Transcript_16021:172-1623(-)